MTEDLHKRLYNLQHLKYLLPFTDVSQPPKHDFLSSCQLWGSVLLLVPPWLWTWYQREQCSKKPEMKQLLWSDVSWTWLSGHQEWKGRMGWHSVASQDHSQSFRIIMLYLAKIFNMTHWIGTMPRNGEDENVESWLMMKQMKLPEVIELDVWWAG